MRKQNAGTIRELTSKQVVNVLLTYPRGVDEATLGAELEAQDGRWSKDLSSILITLERRSIVERNAGWVTLAGSIPPGEEWTPAGWHRVTLAILDRLADGGPMTLDQMAKWVIDAFSLGRDFASEKRLKNRLSKWLFNNVHAQYGDVKVFGGSYSGLTYTVNNLTR